MSTAAQRFPIDRLSDLAEEVADFFGAAAIVSPGQKVRVGPPIELWSASLVESADSTPTLSQIARWTGRYHHQVLEDPGPPLGYVLTRLEGDEVVLSTVSDAAEFAGDVENGLVELRKRIDEEAFVRLLSVPELQLEALWAAARSAAEGTVLVIRVEPGVQVEAEVLLSERAIVELLMRHPPVEGGIFGVQSLLDLLDVPLKGLIAGSIGEEGDKYDSPPVTLDVVYDRVEMVA
ncbi:MAG TPA: hypothetical protein VL242_49810 [Sorangium sp.]|nr:hypothetical protein [Sorangium sp.]